MAAADQTFFTSRELAELAANRGLTGFPASETGVRSLAKRSGWNGLPASLARRRSGSEGGGGMEYHCSLLPDTMQAALASQTSRQALRQARALAVDGERRQMQALQAQSLGAGRRSTMMARAEILTSIEGFAISHGQRRSWAVTRFVAAQKEWVARQEIETRRDRGAILTAADQMQLARALILTATDGFNLTPALLREANDRPRPGREVVSERTIWRWFKTRDAESAVALAPVPPKSAAPVPAAFGHFLKFYARPSKPSISEAHGAYLEAAARADHPGLTLTLSQCRHILRERLNSIERNVGREGLLTLRSRMAYVTRTTEDMWPTTVYTADGKTFDAEVADPVSRRPMRPEITSVLDVATRRCVGYAVSRKENVIAVTEALRRSCSAFGIPAIFYTDRGAGYKNKAFDADAGGLMARLGITKMHALPYNSQAKGIIERFNAVWNDLAKRMPSYIGADMDKEAKKLVHQESRREVREFGASRLLSPWDEFIALVEAEIALYNARPHQGLPRFADPATGKLRHMSPDEAWAAHVASGFEAVTIDAAEADDLFRPYELRTCRRGLVEWNTNQYFAPELEAWHELQVMVGYDLTQAEKVWVREFDAETHQPGRLICVATFGGNKQRYIPLTQEQAALEGRAKGQLRRLGRKIDAVNDQLKAPMLDVARSVPTPVFDIAEQAMEISSTTTPAPARADVDVTPITSDADLAKLVLADPGQLTEGRLRALREVMSRRNGRELLRISGVDLTTLDDLLRSAA